MRESFEESVERFREFLRSNRYPHKIVWLKVDDLIVTGERFLYVRDIAASANEHTARKLFESCATEGRAIVFETPCQGDGVTFCNAWSPRDRSEAQRYLVGDGLKMSVKTDASRFPAKIVRNQLEWFFLRLRYSKFRWLAEQLFRGRQV